MDRNPRESYMLSIQAVCISEHLNERDLPLLQLCQEFLAENSQLTVNRETISFRSDNTNFWKYIKTVRRLAFFLLFPENKDDDSYKTIQKECYYMMRVELKNRVLEIPAQFKYFFENVFLYSISKSPSPFKFTNYSAKSTVYLTQRHDNIGIVFVPKNQTDSVVSYKNPAKPKELSTQLNKQNKLIPQIECSNNKNLSSVVLVTQSVTESLPVSKKSNMVDPRIERITSKNSTTTSVRSMSSPISKNSQIVDVPLPIEPLPCLELLIASLCEKLPIERYEKTQSNLKVIINKFNFGKTSNDSEDDEESEDETVTEKNQILEVLDERQSVQAQSKEILPAKNQIDSEEKNNKINERVTDDECEFTCVKLPPAVETQADFKYIANKPEIEDVSDNESDAETKNLDHSEIIIINTINQETAINNEMPLPEDDEREYFDRYSDVSSASSPSYSSPPYIPPKLPNYDSDDFLTSTVNIRVQTNIKESLEKGDTLLNEVNTKPAKTIETLMNEAVPKKMFHSFQKLVGPNSV